MYRRWGQHDFGILQAEMAMNFRETEISGDPQKQMKRSTSELTMDEAVPVSSRVLDAISRDSVEDIKAIHEQGYDFNKPVLKLDEIESNLILPITHACVLGSVEVLRFFLEIGVDTTIPGANGKLPIHYTCDNDEWSGEQRAECVRALRVLIEGGCDVNVVDNMGRTPLFLACEADNVEAVRLLVSSGCDVNIPTVCGDSPMKVACRNAKYWSYWHGKDAAYLGRKSFDFPPVQITKILLHANVDLSEATLLPTAVQLCDARLIEELLDLGMDINMLDDNMCTPLGIACSTTHVGPELVTLLLQRGADVNKGGGWKKQKPLIFAYVHNSVEKIKVLLSNGAKMSPHEMTELVSLTLTKSILENPEVITPDSKELLSWRLLMAHGFSPVVTGTELYYKVHQLGMCSSYDKIKPWLHGMLFPLRSLKELCRISIRQNVGISVDDNINKLPLPGSIKDFLKVNEIVMFDES